MKKVEVILNGTQHNGESMIRISEAVSKVKFGVIPVYTGISKSSWIADSGILPIKIGTGQE